MSRALFIGAASPVMAGAIRGWLAAGNTISAIWLPSRKAYAGAGRDARLSLLAPRWSVAAIARRQRIPVREVPRLAAWPGLMDAVREAGGDAMVSVYFPHVVPPSMLDHFGGRAVNLHPSPLPRYRGPRPIATMILDHTAHADTTMTLHVMAEGLDEGPIIAQEPIDFDWRRGQVALVVASARVAASLAGNQLVDYLAGRMSAVAQDESRATYASTHMEDLVIHAGLTVEEVSVRCALVGSRGRLPVEGFDRGGVSRLVRVTGPPTGAPAQSGRWTIEMDVVDGRVVLARKHALTGLAGRIRTIATLIRTPL